MKKKNLKSLALNRRTVSNLETSQNLGGAGSTAPQCAITIFNCVTLQCVRTENCIPLTKQECVSIVIDCITQTEFPTCRDCI
jgi:hypothetical protein